MQAKEKLNSGKINADRDWRYQTPESAGAFIVFTTRVIFIYHNIGEYAKKQKSNYYNLLKKCNMAMPIKYYYKKIMCS